MNTTTGQKVRILNQGTASCKLYTVTAYSPDTPGNVVLSDEGILFECPTSQLLPARALV